MEKSGINRPFLAYLCAVILPDKIKPQQTNLTGALFD